MKKLIVTAALVLAANAAYAQDLPPGRWWRNGQIAERLELSGEQQTRLDAIFHNAANELIDRRAEVEKASLALRGELDQTQPNRANLQRLAARLSEARARLFEREVLMLADMRAVLEDDQWNELRQHARQRMGERMNRRHSMPPRRPPMPRRH